MLFSKQSHDTGRLIVLFKIEVEFHLSIVYGVLVWHR